MTLALGTKLGPYEIVAPLGAGGMGEVYRAKDTRLERTVAIKILPAQFSSDPVRKQRFEREAKTISSLNHPHICVLYDVGSQDGVDYLVMECVEGETLAKRLEKGSLPLDQVVKFGAQIADALGTAHRSGVVHRDLKPGNIMLTATGAKLLDFGLAKPAVLLATAVTLSAATQNSPVTEQGTIVGTFQYMSPEQVEGKEVDARSDIFSLGAVLYEMLTGRRAFEGKSQLSVASAILEKEPALISTVKPMTPPTLERVVKICLAKDPEDRWQTGREVKRELHWVAEASQQVPAKAWPVKNARGMLAAVAVLAVVAVTLGVVHIGERLPEAAVVRTFIPPPDKTTFNFNVNTSGNVAVSPDGRRLAFSATSTGGKHQIWVRSLDALAAQPLAGTEGAEKPFWSPDSRYLGFFADGKLKKIDISGGPPVTLCDAPFGRGGTWNRDGVIVFSPDDRSLHRVSASGGVSTPVTKLDVARRETSHPWPWFLPDGRHFLYLAAEGIFGGLGAGGSIRIGSIDAKEESKVVVEASSNAVYAQGYLLYLRESTLMAQPFDCKRLVTSGDAVPVAEQVQHNPGILLGVFSVSENGLLAYQAGAEGSRLVWFDRSGKQVSTLGDPGIINRLHLSPNRKSVAISSLDPATRNSDIWLYDVTRGLRTRFTFDPAAENEAIWSPDGRSIAFNSNRKGHSDIYQKASSGEGAEELLYADNLDKAPTSWSPDGKFLLYYSSGDPKTGQDIWVLPLTGERKPFAFVRTNSNEIHAQFSPDGHWIAYQSDEIYVAPFPGPEGAPVSKRQISTGGGAQARWRRDGKEIFYIAQDNRLMAAEVSIKGATLEIGAVRPLFGPLSTGAGYQYDVSADGQRFLAVVALEQPAADSLTLVQNWKVGLKK
jgi:serine/threonine protein kinase/Tol biopolymer transport system component